MFNYHDLDDVEFEILCKDIMQVKLNLELRAFGKGRDGGVDLTDNVKTHNVVVQIKHYINSTFANLKSSLQKEVEKVERLKPNRYYVCCSQELTDQNVNEIYSLFSDYMQSDKNIITLKEIDDFLQDGKNIDVVRKNFKLWLSSSNILSEIYNQNIFIDCEALLYDIKSEAQYFVRTHAFNECLKVLEKQRALILIGAPGVGKTITSKMLTLYFADNGYRVRYTTNGDLSDLKKAISVDKDCKEVILLDDCLGQCYFKLSDTQENELLSLIKYVKLNDNKIIILNSRVTIFNEAQNHSQDFKLFIQSKRIKLRVIDMDMITPVEKARIFYNHLKVNHIPNEHYRAVRNSRNYMNIVGHPNYNPRLIEYVTSPNHYSNVQPEAYYEYIVFNLNNPKDVWKNEFDRRLRSVDRIFMNILFSLTENMVESEIVKECFYNRLMQEVSVDFTIDNFDLTLMRLNQSLVKIVDDRGKMKIGVLNPSINDYLKSIFFDNCIELANMKKSILYYMQLPRCYAEHEFEDILKSKVADGSILFLKDHNQNRIIALTVYLICKFKICTEQYVDIIYNNLNTLSCYNAIDKLQFKKYDAVKELFEEPLCSFYKISDQIKSLNFIDKLLGDLDLDDLVSIVIDIETSDMMERQEEIYEEFFDVSKTYINSAIAEFLDSYDLQDFYDELDIADILNDSKNEIEAHTQSNIGWDDERIFETAVKIIHNLAVNEMKSSMEDIIYRLNSDYNGLIIIPDVNCKIDDKAIENLISSFGEPDYDDEYYDCYRDEMKQFDVSNEFNEIDLILDRDI